ncbi:glycosyltransferase family 39 protein [uncultured Massilia sp.]|uniref:ArnT family glycosyltransferase n=1 Tax=uncultured Massilia sp. TaxID=169973 RepID=UPI002586ECA3|nr:glycosyltransferase family 39 protein [uncultured Massilia sp.]
MIPNDAARRSPTWPLALLLSLAVVAWFVYQRNHGLHPTVFADEWYYSRMARLVPLADAIVPSYLYLWIFGASASCGDGFLECVRAGNLAFYLAGSPFVYLTARRFTSAPVSFFLALLAALAPLNVYTAYFMPEATYYFGFCVLAWIALTRTGWHPVLYALAAGVVLGAMSLVKVHAIFLLPAIVPFLLYASWDRGGAWFLRGVLMALVATAATFAMKFGLGWLLAGEAGLSLLGPFYQGGVGGGSRLKLIAPAFINGRAHLAILTMLYGVPLAILLYELCTRSLRARGDARNLLHVFVFLTLGAAAGLTVVYTASLAAPGSNEGLRMHLRYYSFVFPLLYIVAAAAMHARAPDAPAVREWPRLRWALVLAMAALLVFALLRLHTYALNTVDGPDIGGIDLTGPAGRILMALQLALLVTWAARKRIAAPLFVFVALPAALWAGHVGSDKYLQAHRPPGQADLAGKYVSSVVPRAERGSVVVAGDDMGLIMRAQFQIDHPDSVPMLLDKPGPLPEYLMPINKKWIVLLGANNSMPTSLTPALRTPHYTVVRLPDPDPALGRMPLSTEPDGKFVTKLEGLSHAEPWGRWSDAKQVVIHFAEPLPRRVGVVLNARAFDDNADLPFKATLGGVEKEFRIGWHLQEIGLHFDTDGSARTLVIKVPKPVSPAERGNPGDPRKLGIGIAEITITDGTRTVHAAR